MKRTIQHLIATAAPLIIALMGAGCTTEGPLGPAADQPAEGDTASVAGLIPPGQVEAIPAKGDGVSIYWQDGCSIEAGFEIERANLQRRIEVSDGLPEARVQRRKDQVPDKTDAIGQADEKLIIGEFNGVGYAAANASSYCDRTVSKGCTYLYRVVAFDDAGNRACSEVVAVTVVADGEDDDSNDRPDERYSRDRHAERVIY